jgi:hypothetical protein
MIRPVQSPRELVRLLCREFHWTMEYSYSRTLDDLFGDDGIIKQEDLSLIRRNWIRNHRNTIVQRDDGRWERPTMAELITQSGKAESKLKMARAKQSKRR